MNIELKQIDDISVLILEGFFNKDFGDYKIKNIITEILNNGAKKILIDLNAIKFINSAGIGELVGSYISISNRGAKVRLFGVPERVDKMLNVTKLISIFDIYKSEDEAVASFE